MTYPQDPGSTPRKPGRLGVGIVELGEGVTGVQVDDLVIGMFPLNEHGGAAEYAVIAAEFVASAPNTNWPPSPPPTR